MTIFSKRALAFMLASTMVISCSISTPTDIDKGIKPINSLNPLNPGNDKNLDPKLINLNSEEGIVDFGIGNKETTLKIALDKKNDKFSLLKLLLGLDDQNLKQPIEISKDKLTSNNEYTLNIKGLPDKDFNKFSYNISALNEVKDEEFGKTEGSSSLESLPKEIPVKLIVKETGIKIEINVTNVQTQTGGDQTQTDNSVNDTGINNVNNTKILEYKGFKDENQITDFSNESQDEDKDGLGGSRSCSYPYNGVNFYGQCVPAARRYIATKYGYTFPYLGGIGNSGAYLFWDIAKPDSSKMQRIEYKGNNLPQKDDVVIYKPWGNNPYGHIAIVKSVNGKDNVELVESNWSSYECGGTHTIKSTEWSLISGWYRPLQTINQQPIVDNKPAFTNVDLETQITKPDKKYFTGFASDDKGLSVITMKVEGPKGKDITAFTEQISNKTEQFLNNYYFDSNNNTYAGVAGTYYVTLWIKDSSNQAVSSKTFTINVTEKNNTNDISNLTKIYRYKSNKDNMYFYSNNSKSEDIEYTYQDEAFYLFSNSSPSTRSFYKCVGSKNVGYFYTTDSNCENSELFTNVGILGYISNAQTTGTVPLFRFYIDGTPFHYYSTSKQLTSELISEGWKMEATVGYVIKI